MEREILEAQARERKLGKALQAVAFGGGEFPAYADTAPLAICRAALAAVRGAAVKEG